MLRVVVCGVLLFLCLCPSSSFSLFSLLAAFRGEGAGDGVGCCCCCSLGCVRCCCCSSVVVFVVNFCLASAALSSSCLFRCRFCSCFRGTLLSILFSLSLSFSSFVVFVFACVAVGGCPFNPLARQLSGPSVSHNHLVSKSPPA